MAIHKLVINGNIESICDFYVAQLCTKIGGSKEYYVVERLNIAINEFNKKRNKKVVRYLKLIKEHYEEILRLKPWQFDNIIVSFEAILTKQLLKNPVSFRKFNKELRRSTIQKRIPIHEMIVNIMDYKNVQQVIFPVVIRKLNIKTCVYCNTQFAISTDDNKAFYQLDHCYPKAKYPFLCTSFFNLQPSCSSCNQHKLDLDPQQYSYRDINNLSIWKNPNVSVDNLFFRLDEASLSNYLANNSSHNAELLNIQYGQGNSTKDKRFHITNQYNQLKDVAEEVIWRHQIYSKGYYHTIESAFQTLFPDIKSQVDRLIYGNYLSKENIFKRPLSKFMQDIKKQLEEDEGE